MFLSGYCEQVSVVAYSPYEALVHKGRNSFQEALVRRKGNRLVMRV